MDYALVMGGGKTISDRPRVLYRLAEREPALCDHLTHRLAF